MTNYSMSKMHTQANGTSLWGQRRVSGISKVELTTPLNLKPIKEALDDLTKFAVSHFIHFLMQK